MSKWFGESWGAPACDPDDHVPTPAGQECCYCDLEIKPDDQGFVFPLVTAVGDPLTPTSDFQARVEFIIYRLDCFVQSITPCKGCPNCQPLRFN